MAYFTKKSEWARTKAAELRAISREQHFTSSGGSWRLAKRKFEGMGHLDGTAQEWDRWARYYEHPENIDAWRALTERLSSEGRTLSEAVAAGDAEAVCLNALPVEGPPRRPLHHPGRRRAA